MHSILFHSTPQPSSSANQDLSPPPLDRFLSPKTITPLHLSPSTHHLTSLHQPHQLLHQFQAVYNVIGYGARSQYKDLDSTLHSVSKLAEQLDDQHGQHQWLIVFGADRANPDQPDIGMVVKHLKTQHGAPVVALALDILVEDFPLVSADSFHSASLLPPSADLDDAHTAGAADYDDGVSQASESNSNNNYNNNIHTNDGCGVE